MDSFYLAGPLQLAPLEAILPRPELDLVLFVQQAFLNLRWIAINDASLG